MRHFLGQFQVNCMYMEKNRAAKKSDTENERLPSASRICGVRIVDIPPDMHLSIEFSRGRQDIPGAFRNILWLSETLCPLRFWTAEQNSEMKKRR